MFLVGIEAWRTATGCEGSRDTKSLPCDTWAMTREQERQAPVAPRRGPRTCLEGGNLFITVRQEAMSSQAQKGPNKPGRGFMYFPHGPFSLGRGSRDGEASRALAPKREPTGRLATAFAVPSLRAPVPACAAAFLPSEVSLSNGLCHVTLRSLEMAP